MTARDEAIRALSAARDLLYHEEQDFGPLDSRYVEFMVDAIPPAVLARLAIETGGLVDTGFAQGRSGTVYPRSGAWNPDDHGHYRLYRIAEDPS